MPRLDIYNFEGLFKTQNTGVDAEREGLGLSHTLWGNCYLANGKATGIVVYTGREMRSVMNTRDARNKTGRIDAELNFLSKVLFAFMCLLAVIITIAGGLG